MQIVIDISKEKYNEIMSMDWVNCRRFFDEEIRAIHDGKVLPKGHGRLIDENNLWFEDIDDISCVTQRNVENAPTIIEADKGYVTLPYHARLLNEEIELVESEDKE